MKGTVSMGHDLDASAGPLLSITAAEFRELFHGGAFGLCLVDTGGRLVDVNDAFCDYLGRDRAWLAGQTLPALVHPDDRAALAESHARLMAGTGRRVRGELRLLHGDGRTLWASASVVRLVTEDGTPVALTHLADITAQKSAEHRLVHADRHDALTGLANRRQVLERIAEALTEPGRRTVAVIMLDLDEFQRVNDSLGHEGGDELLVAVARRLAKLANRGHRGDLVARLGGDEFAVLCDHTSTPRQVRRLAGRILDTLATPVRVRGRDLVVSASIGIAMSPPDTGSAADLLRYAGTAVVRAKRRGRSRYEFFDQLQGSVATTRLDVELQLRRAIGHDELTLHYQPLVDPGGGLVAVEALVRWEHPERGLLAPSAFLHATSTSDLSAALDRWVLARATDQLCRWRRDFPSSTLTVAVNVGAAHLLRPDCVRTLGAVLERAGVDPSQVCLELPETQLADIDTRHDPAAMRGLRALGVRLAVDDFGVGCFNLSHLKELPTEILKIDRSLVRNVGREAADTSILAAVVAMAHATGRTCVAEGVETDGQWRELIALGCDQFQGYHLGRPAPPARITELLAAGSPLPASPETTGR